MPNSIGCVPVRAPSELVLQANKTFDDISSNITDIANEMSAGTHDTFALVWQELKRLGQVAKQ